MPRYYVAGIPFDSNDALQHYGVKGMKWNQHIFGIDANDKYINWLKDAGQNIGKFTNNAAKTIGNAAAGASREVGKALNKASNFVTGNQARQNVDTANTNAANVQSGRSKVNDAYARYDQLRNSEAQHRTNANGWRESQANRAPLENFGRTQDRINADNEDRRANRDANRAEIAKMKADRMAERQRNAETQARAEAKNAQQAYDRTLPGAAENAARGAQGFLNSAGKWVSNAVRDAGNAADEAYRNSGMKGLVDDVQNRLTGNTDRNTAEMLRRTADAQENPNSPVHATGEQYNPERLRAEAAEYDKKADNALLNRVGQAVNNAGKTANDAGNAIGNAANGAREWLGNMFNGAKEWAGNAAKDVGNFATNAVNDVGKAANDAGQWLGDRAKDAGETLGNAANGAREWAGQAVNDARNFISNRDEEQRMNELAKSYDPNTGKWRSESDRQAFYEAQNAYNSHPLTSIPEMARQMGSDIANGPVGNFVRNAGNMANQIGSDVSNYVDYNITGAGQNRDADMYEDWIRQNREKRGAGQPAYQVDREADLSRAANEAREDAQNNTLFGRIGNAANAVGNWVGNAAKDVSNAAGSAVNAVGKAANDAGQWIGDRAQDAGNFLSEVANPHYQLDAERLTENYRNYLNEHPENPQSPKHEEWLKEQIRNDPQLREYYERMMKHSALSDKPDGVGNAFWQNYIAHGGTREDYERDWR